MLRQLRSVTCASGEGLCRHTSYLAEQFLGALNSFEAATLGIRRVGLAMAISELSTALYVEPIVPNSVYCGRLSHHHPPPAILTQNYQRVLDHMANSSGLCLHCEQLRAGQQVCESGHPIWI